MKRCISAPKTPPSVKHCTVNIQLIQGPNTKRASQKASKIKAFRGAVIDVIRNNLSERHNRHLLTFSLNLLTVRKVALLHGRSVISRIVFGDVTFLRTDILGTSPNDPQALEITGLLDVSVFFSWVYYKTKGYKKSLMP